MYESPEVRAGFVSRGDSLDMNPHMCNVSQLCEKQFKYLHIRLSRLIGGIPINFEAIVF